MKKNVASQAVGAQLISKTDGSAVTSGTTTVYVTGDAGTQATGTVGSGAATHEGNGYWTYAPSQAETNYDLAAFTFVNSSAVNATVQIYTSFPQTGDNYARLGAPAGASVSADVAAVKAVLPAALVSGRIDASVGAMASGVLTATAIAADAITDAKVASDVTIASVTGSVGSVTGDVGGNVTGSIGSLATQAKADVNAEADAALADAGVTTTVTGRIDAAISTRLAGASYTAPLDAAGTRTAVGLASANLDTQLGALPTAAENADAVWDEAIADHAGSGSTGEALSAAGAAGDPWITTLPGSYTSGQAGYIIGTNLDATVGSRATQSSVDTIDNYVDTEVAAIKAKTDLIPSSPAAVSDIPTTAQVADKILGRSLAGGADGGRTVQDALRSLRNKSSIAGGTLTVCEEDDSTPAWTATVTTAAGDPLSSIDPA